MKKKIWISMMIGLIATVLGACGNAQAPAVLEETAGGGQPSFAGQEVSLDYAEGFSLTRMEDGCTLITIADGGRFLVVPEGAKVPGDVEEGTTVVEQPVEQIYLAATAVMDMFTSIGGLDAIRLSGTKEDGWYIPEARDAMASGAIVYAGKYNMPDYERILREGCSLAVESTMIYHAPEVKEKLEALGIPVLVDRSSYEPHPLGRTEWVKLYGALLGREEEAEAVFQKQKEALRSVEQEEPTGKTVAFFYITSAGSVSVRRSGDYVPKMFQLAGGTYIFSDLGDDSAASSVNMQMEEFYARAKDTDYLIYNSTIDGELHTREALLEKSPLLAEFRAFSEGRVFCTTQNLYQESMKTGEFVRDVHRMLTMERGAETAEERAEAATEETTDEAFTYLFPME